MEDKTEQLKEMLKGLTNMEKEFSKFSTTIGSDLSKSFGEVIKEAMIDFEKRTKINKKQATLSLMKDGSVRIVFDNPDDGVKFAKGEK